MISGLIIYSCKKKEPQDKEPLYDLFPLKVGNEFYYKYQHKYFNFPHDGFTKGTEIWKVVSEYTQGDFNYCTIQRNLNAILVIDGRDTTTISNSITNFRINENRSSSLLSSTFGFNYGEISFKRYQLDSTIKI